MIARGQRAYKLYRALTYGFSPLLNLHIRWRRFRGLEHPLRWPERLGFPSSSRPPGPLLWFHAVSLGEGMAVIPVIKHCIQQRPDLNVLMTTTTASAFDVIKNWLPDGVIYQFAPIDTPVAVDAFLGYWKPNAVIIMESELWPNLIMGASRNGITLALLNGRVSAKSFEYWSAPVLLPLISLMLSKFSLIVPLSTIQAIRFQLLQAPPLAINFSGDLKYAVASLNNSETEDPRIKELSAQLANRPVWMASSVHKGEEKVMLEVHKVLMRMHPDIITIIVPRHPHLGQEIANEAQLEGLNVALRSRDERLVSETNIYVADTLGELRRLYELTPIAVIGGSFLPGLAGHNVAEAAAAGCAVLTGSFLGHFSDMVMKMQELNPISVLQVSGKAELVEALSMLFRKTEALEAHRMASKQAYHHLSDGVVLNVWKLISSHILEKT
ncbi:3-deoxy-D-manno-octulosonic-acid transferase, N-terminal [Dillenia turbinata]|uniref:lipid IVA 3-deoxy-D-manno-octulosonic acid transferase n=1 Tax=Dillenia turbinata TaxID=194707 RepID=A0AAN8ZM99_9MAGN